MANANVRLLGPDLATPLVLEVNPSDTVGQLKEKALENWPSGALPTHCLRAGCFASRLHNHHYHRRRRYGGTTGGTAEDHPPGSLLGRRSCSEGYGVSAATSLLYALPRVTLPAFADFNVKD